MYQENDVLIRLKSLLETKSDLFMTLARKYMRENTLFKEEPLDEKKISIALRAEQRNIEKMDRIDREIEDLIPEVEYFLNSGPAVSEDLRSMIRKLLVDMDLWSEKVGAYNTFNKEMFENFAKKKRRDIKQFRNTKTVISRYGLNMKDSHVPNTSYFLDKKK